MPPERRPSLVSAILQTQVANAAGLFLAIGTSILTARALGVEGRGEYSLVLVLTGLISTVVNLGVPSAIVYYVGGGRMSGSRMVKNVAVAAIGLGAVGVGSVLLLERAGLLHFLLGAAALTPAMRLAVLAVPLALLGSFLMNVLLAEGRITAFNALPLAGQAAGLLCLGLVHWARGLTPLLAVAVAVFVQFLSVVTVFCLRGDARGVAKSPWVGRQEIVGLASYAGISHAGNVVQFLNYRAGTLLVNHYLGFAGVGLYTLATSLAELLWLLSRPVATVLFPRMSEPNLDNRRIEIALQATRFTFYATILTAIAAAIGAPLLIPALYGSAFAPAIRPFLILLPGVALFSVANVLAAYLAGTGRPTLNFLAALGSLGIGLPLMAAFIPTLGLTGAAFATTIGYVAGTTIVLAFTMRKTGSKLGRYVIPPTLADIRRLLASR